MTKVLMLGWEFPPVNSGGLGVASKALAENLAKNGIELTFTIPSFIGEQTKNIKIPFDLAYNDKPITFTQTVKTTIASPYGTEEQYRSYVKTLPDTKETKEIYGKNLFEEIERYGEEVEKLHLDKEYDLIHAHDWITCPAALRLKKRLGIPLVIHVHATEYDRTGGNYNPGIYDIEKKAWEAADRLIAVSYYTKDIIVHHYGIDPKKVEVVHNGKDDKVPSFNKVHTCRSDKKTVLFLGRLTHQKGPDWFLKVAEKVLQKRKDVQFLIAGGGDMMPKIVEEIAQKGFHREVFCLGFLSKSIAL